MFELELIESELWQSVRVTISSLGMKCSMFTARFRHSNEMEGVATLTDKRFRRPSLIHQIFLWPSLPRPYPANVIPAIPASHCDNLNHCRCYYQTLSAWVLLKSLKRERFACSTGFTEIS